MEFSPLNRLFRWELVYFEPFSKQEGKIYDFLLRGIDFHRLDLLTGYYSPFEQFFTGRITGKVLALNIAVVNITGDHFLTQLSIFPI